MSNSAIANQPAASDLFLWSRERFEELFRIGFFDENRRLELLDGYILKKAVQNPPHSVCCEIVRRALERAAGPGYHVRDQKPLALDDLSEPEPDLALVQGSVLDYSHQHPEKAELVVEVSDTTLAKDRGPKRKAYARNGIPEYWVINLAERQIEVHRGAVGQDYEEARVFKSGESVSLSIGSKASKFPVDELIP